MKNRHPSRNRLYASLLILGASILLFRTLKLLSEGALEVLVLWVSILLIAELLIDLSCILSSIKWWKTNDKKNSLLPLRLGAAAAIFHAFRVLIFIIGRVGPWIDFDVKPEHRLLHHTRWTWEGIYFAGIMSVLGVLGVILIWSFRKHSQTYK